MTRLLSYPGKSRVDYREPHIGTLFLPLLQHHVTTVHRFRNHIVSWHHEFQYWLLFRCNMIGAALPFIFELGEELVLCRQRIVNSRLQHSEDPHRSADGLCFSQWNYYLNWRYYHAIRPCSFIIGTPKRLAR